MDPAAPEDLPCSQAKAIRIREALLQLAELRRILPPVNGDAGVFGNDKRWMKIDGDLMS